MGLATKIYARVI